VTFERTLRTSSFHACRLLASAQRRPEGRPLEQIGVAPVADAAGIPPAAPPIRNFGASRDRGLLPSGVDSAFCQKSAVPHRLATNPHPRFIAKKPAMRTRLGRESRIFLNAFR
jgi:hypothetical protein